jgi:hypothetical protein
MNPLVLTCRVERKRSFAHTKDGCPAWWIVEACGSPLTGDEICWTCCAGLETTADSFTPKGADQVLAHWLAKGVL